MSPEESLAAAYAAERRKNWPGSGDKPTRSERETAAWVVAKLREAGWRLLRQPVTVTTTAPAGRYTAPPICPECGDGSPEQGGHALGGCNGKCLPRRKEMTR